MIPFPVIVKEGIETFFQHTSAEAAFWMIKLAGISIYREGLAFHLSSIVMEVAPQCSGIRSSLVLFITSLVASHLFLKAGWKRFAIVLFVIPLAILRNGFRISTLAYLCEKISPDMIDSWVHHRGGPLFFALSLIPFFILLYLLWRTEPKMSSQAEK
jgi:exosortase C (VPDSG-CTERM-specific)